MSHEGDRLYSTLLPSRKDDCHLVAAGMHNTYHTRRMARETFQDYVPSLDTGPLLKSIVRFRINIICHHEMEEKSNLPFVM